MFDLHRQVDTKCLQYIRTYFYTIKKATCLDYLPSAMFHHNTLTYLSRSYLECSWKNPSACKISCVTLSVDEHPFPKETFCFPPCRPTDVKHLTTKREQKTK